MQPGLARRFVLVLALGAGLLLPGLGRMPAYDPTDARYLEVSREMHASGDPLVPHLAGVPHLDKPPLTYWAAALGFELFGVGEFGGRFLQQLALLATAGLIFAYGRRPCGLDGACAATLVFLTSGLVFVSSRVLATDLFQLLFSTWALLALFSGCAAGGSPRQTALGFALLGAAMLAKGPIALLVALAVLVPFLLLARGRTTLSWRGVGIGLVLFAALGAPWYAILVHRSPELLHYFLFAQLLGRVSAGGAGHVHGPAYLAAAWAIGLLPWTPLAALALWRLRPGGTWRSAQPFDVYLLLWALVPVGLFSVFATKLPTYILPAFPAAALAVGRASAGGLLDDAGGRRARLVCALLAALLAFVVAVGLGAPRLHGHAWLEPLDPKQLAWPAGFATALLAVAGLALVAALRWLPRVAASRGIAGISVLAAAVFLLGFNAVAPGLARFRGVGEVIDRIPEAHLVEYGAFYPGPLFFSGRLDRFHLAEVGKFDALAPDLAQAPYLHLSHAEAVQLLDDAAPTLALARDRNATRLERETAAQPVWRGRGFVLLANRSALRLLEARSPTPVP